MQDRHKAGHLSAVSDMIRGITRLVHTVHDIVRAAAYCGKSAQDQVMYTGHTFRCDADSSLRQHNVIVDQRRTMAHLNKHILTHHRALCHGNAFRRVIVMQKVLGNTSPLRLPVTPDTHRRMVDMVAAHHNVDCCM